MKIDWQQLAKDRGFNSVKEMLRTFYNERKMSINKIADELIVSPSAVHQKMKRLGIKTRRYYKGIPCPTCGHQMSTIKVSFPANGDIFRRRYCKKCGHPFITRESVC